MRTKHCDPALRSLLATLVLGGWFAAGSAGQDRYGSPPQTSAANPFSELSRSPAASPAAGDPRYTPGQQQAGGSLSPRPSGAGGVAGPPSDFEVRPLSPSASPRTDAVRSGDLFQNVPPQGSRPAAPPTGAASASGSDRGGLGTGDRSGLQRDPGQFGSPPTQPTGGSRFDRPVATGPGAAGAAGGLQRSASNAGVDLAAPGGRFGGANPLATRDPSLSLRGMPTATVSAERERSTRAVLAAMLTAPKTSRLAGTPMRLASVLAGAPTREDQARRTEAYWALSSAVADYYLGLEEINELGRLQQRLPTYTSALGEAQAELTGRVETSLRAARIAQVRLARVVGSDVRPLPADVPFCGPYATRYQEIFPGGGPEEAALLQELLPLRLGELMAAEAAVRRNEDWVGKVAEDRDPNSDGRGIIQALELLALSRRAFVQIARDYNLQISRYAQLATPGSVDSGRLVAMLIRTDATPELANQPSDQSLLPRGSRR